MASSPLDLCAVWGTQCETRSDSGSGFQFPPPSDRRGRRPPKKRRPGDTSLTCRPIRRDASRPKLGGVEDFFWTRGAFPPENSRKHHGFFRVKHQRFGRIGIPAFEKPYLFGSRTVKPEISSAVSFFGGLFEDGIISIIGLRNDLTNLDWSHTQLDL